MWGQAADSLGLDSLVDMILTGRDSRTAMPEDFIRRELSLLPSGSAVLDFGCGVGRNLLFFATEMPWLQFVGYDSQAMLDRADEFCLARLGKPVSEVKNLQLMGDWGRVSSIRFSCIYATLVFQHISPDELRLYVESMKIMTPLLLVHGRRANDYSPLSTWRLLESFGLFPANAASIGYVADGECEEHLPACRYEMASHRASEST